MANTNLAQHEQYLKQLESSLKEFGILHLQMHDALSETKVQTHVALMAIALK